MRSPVRGSSKIAARRVSVGQGGVDGVADGERGRAAGAWVAGERLDGLREVPAAGDGQAALELDVDRDDSVAIGVEELHGCVGVDGEWEVGVVEDVFDAATGQCARESGGLKDGLVIGEQGLEGDVLDAEADAAHELADAGEVDLDFVGGGDE